MAFDPQKGTEVPVLPLSDFMAYAETAGLSVTIVVPTKDFLSEATDANGDRTPEFDEAALSKFVTDVSTGVYGDVTIDAFELGNEYWGSGEMSSVEYGRLSSKMATVINETLTSLETSHPATSEIDIVVQAGTNFNFAGLSDRYDHLDSNEAKLAALTADYGLEAKDDHTFVSGAVNWTGVANTLISREFDTSEEQEALDGVVNHVYSREPAVPGTRDFSLNAIENSWISQFPELDIYITEWNQKSATGAFGENDYGLKQAHEMLNIVEAFMEAGVDNAYVWPVLQNTKNALAYGKEFEDLTPGGEMFGMMERELVGQQMLDFSQNYDQTELSFPDLDVHGFGSENKLVLYLASTSNAAQSSQVDLSGLFSTGATMDVTYLGVAPGENPGAVNATADVEKVNGLDASTGTFTNGVLNVDLAPYEIMQVVVNDPTWTPDMANLWSGEAGAISNEAESEVVLPTIDPPPETDFPMDDESDVAADDGGMDAGGGMEWLIALLPLLLVVGLV
ncbi:MAG: type I secretion protein [Paracoccaceae bacterium]